MSIPRRVFLRFRDFIPIEHIPEILFKITILKLDRNLLEDFDLVFSIVKNVTYGSLINDNYGVVGERQNPFGDYNTYSFKNK